MRTPIWDFLRDYQHSGNVRLHMPGHKGVSFLGCEGWDLTEVGGADSLYEAEGIIAESEENATVLFGTGRTVYSTEGSSQCIRAMLYLALQHRKPGTRPVIVAARNAHKAFLYAAALLDFEIVWLWPEESRSLCGCPISKENLERVLKSLPHPPAAVYITSPDYLGGMADIPGLSEVCHRYGTILAVDNAHGAYLHFLEKPIHPLDLGADICCDSAHKTLPVLTGGAYLHVSGGMREQMGADMKTAMALFGSTSPSYLIMASLDRCNQYLSEGYREKLAHTCEKLDQIREKLRENGWQTENTDPLRITVTGGCGGNGIMTILRQNGMECEHADREAAVLMVTPENREEDLDRIVTVLGKNTVAPRTAETLPLARGRQVVSVRQAIFSPHEQIPVTRALGRICGTPTVACPPAIPIAISGEEIGEEALALFQHYGIGMVDVLK